jgi:uncharacterized protein
MKPGKVFSMRTVALAVGVALAASGSAGADNQGVIPVKSVEFTATPAPVTTDEMSKAYTASSAILTYMNGRTRTIPLSYNVLYSSGDTLGNWTAGAIVDKDGSVLQQAAVDEAGTLAQGPFYAKAPDANSLLRQGKKIFLLTHFEYDTTAPNAADPAQTVDLYGALPMVMNLAGIEQNRKTGVLEAVDLQNVAMNAVDGLWIPCAGELTPWNTHIGGEEYEPDARTYENSPLTAMNLFLGTPGLSGKDGGARPYHYGLATEVEVSRNGRTEVVKHYAMGRLANELAHVMADQRTVYKGDDGRDVILAMFVADRKGDLSEGTLYAAKLFQTDGTGGGKFAVKWIRLGHAGDAEIKSMVDNGIGFSDIFEVASSAEYAANPTAYNGFRPVYTYTGTGGSTTLEYLKVKPGMDKAAAFLETRRFAAYMGATTEFTKMEGETSNADDGKLYIAMSYVQKGMLDGQNADRPQDDIHLTDSPADLDCGVVYESDLAGHQRDTDGNRIFSRLVATNLHGLIQGAGKPAAQTAYGIYDKCDTDKMANPDNIKYSEAMRTLFIGEDSGNHLNNFIWAYNVDSHQLTRILSTRAGGENTGLQVVDNLNGFAYIMANAQHPGAEDDLSGYADKIPDFDTFRAGIDQRGAVGYIGGLPAVQVVRHPHKK